MSERESILFQPLSIGRLALTGRVLKAATSRWCAGRFWRFFGTAAGGEAGMQLSGWRRVAVRLFWPFLAIASNLLWWHYQGFNLKYARRFKERLSIPVIRSAVSRPARRWRRQSPKACATPSRAHARWSPIRCSIGT
jgi:hypothetical protein